ncbi:MAG: HutD family protein [Alphaproteobacteria bacterium]
MPPATLRLLAPGQYRRTPWKNGGGVTVDIADAYRDGIASPGWDGMLWRFGHTRIERNGPFSDLSGFDRLLAVIDGSGLVLHPAGAQALDVRAPFRPVRFPGEWAIVSELTSGAVGVLNLMADRQGFEIDLEFVRGRRVVAAKAGIYLAYALVGGALVRVDGFSQPVPAGHTLRVDAGATVTIEVEDELVALATIRPR